MASQLVGGSKEEYNKLTHGGSPGGVIHEVRVLQTNAWPEKVDENNISPVNLKNKKLNDQVSTPQK